MLSFKNELREKAWNTRAHKLSNIVLDSLFHLLMHFHYILLPPQSRRLNFSLTYSYTFCR